MKSVLVSGVLGAVLAVVINYAIIFMAICFGWKNIHEAPCLPELTKLLHSGITATIVQTFIVVIIGFLVGTFTAKMK